MNNLPPITEQELELIDAYLSGTLPQAEKDAFEQRMQNDPAWSKRVREIKLISIGIQENALRNSLQNIGNTTPARTIPWIRRLAAAAVLVTIVSVLSWLVFFRPSANEKIFAAYYQADDGLPTEMGVSDNYYFEHAMVNYKRGKYEEAIQEWKTLLKKQPGNDTLHYFIASAELAVHHPNEALEGFDAVLKQEQSAFKADAWWYKGLALLMQNKKSAALECIEKSTHPRKAALLLKLKE